MHATAILYLTLLKAEVVHTHFWCFDLFKISLNV